MTPENPLAMSEVMSEFLPDGVDPGRLDGAFPDLNFGPEKEQFYRESKRAAAYALAPVF